MAETRGDRTPFAWPELRLIRPLLGPTSQPPFPAHPREIKSENALQFSSLLWRSCGERGVSVKRRGKQRVRKVEPKVLVEKKAFDKVLGTAMMV